jgi:hypothetical protein
MTITDGGGGGGISVCEPHGAVLCQIRNAIFRGKIGQLFECSLSLKHPPRDRRDVLPPVRDIIYPWRGVFMLAVQVE